jgi:hypothetical protein
MRKSKSKPESKRAAAAAEYRAWQEKHELEHAAKMKRLAPRKETDAEFFAKQAKALEALRRDPVATTLPKPTPAPAKPKRGIDKSDMTLEELDDLRKREEAAAQAIREKMARTGPVYNKGGAVYLSDDLLKDVQAGNTRRRP